jgi:hypothetical protein
MMVEILADFLILKYLFSPIKRIFCRGWPQGRHRGGAGAAATSSSAWAEQFHSEHNNPLL